MTVHETRDVLLWISFFTEEIKGQAFVAATKHSLRQPNVQLMQPDGFLQNIFAVPLLRNDFVRVTKLYFQ